jgi:hypothetical protein
MFINKAKMEIKNVVCGLDIHEKTVFCAVFDGEKMSEVKEFETFTESIKEMGRQLKQKGVKKNSNGKYRDLLDSCMECSGRNELF